MPGLPSISVVTATFNLIEAGREDAFRRAVDCLQEQGLTDLEHVIQDGGSDDGTQEMIRQVTADLPRTVFASEPDEGLYDGMNRAVARATGDYVLFLNSDDALASGDVLKAMQAELHKHRPDYAYGATASQDSQGRETVARRTGLRAVLQRMPFCHNSVLIRRSVFNALGGHDTAFRVAADYDLVLRMVSGGYDGVRVDRPVSLFWTRGVSGDDDRVAQDYARIWQRYFANRRAAAGLTLEEYKRFYIRGHMPLNLMFEVMTDKNAPLAIRHSARHGFSKSLRRALQPWRRYGGE
ncbi:glycosyltransferase family 2 protein [Sedimentitalea nanhaiensis]|uniref:Glycosyltransferase involved in cell wall bisynthesis n=1 Tax=Sedimentitalea nanhaiensis TaxID=999627 RepID=A0A1I6YCL5_9RHOB|nr:glycosyltransferase family 2 protein [Sedimentitalea nanhaiensis]SFT48097.1 Glycosyltransferase involved in cell wall bisynthesis [Sedimentitalea nanhaiensis]